MELQNANPTIINVSDLPTRRRDTRRDTRSKNAPRPGHGQTTADFEAELRWDIPFASGGDTFYKMCGISKDTAISKQVDEIDPEDAGDPIDELEIFDLIATISDPEHPHTLAELAVVNFADIHIDPPPTPGKAPDLNVLTTVTVELTPTITHCSLITIIGLAVRMRLDKCLPPNYRLDVRVKEGTHDQYDQVIKQLADKERVAAALENDTLKQMLNTMMATCKKSGDEAD